MSSPIMSSLMNIAAGVALLTGLSAAVSADSPASIAARDIAPTGSLRVAVAVGPAASTFWATRDPASG
jgi:polar amino acid transport system substrate-binding protein